MIAATVTVKKSGAAPEVFDAIGSSAAEIEETTRNRYEEPVGITVMVRK